MPTRNSLFLPLVLLVSLCLAQTVKTPLKMPFRPDPNLYRSDANAQQEIGHTINEAGKEHKRVILVFGASWCGDCYALDYGFHQPRVEPLLNTNFKVAHVDVGHFDKNLDLVQKYHVDLQKGIPSLAVLTPQGQVLYDTAEFERARVMSEEDIIEFLNTWKASSPSQK